MNCGPGGFPYIIQPGDTFWNLAGQYGTTVEAIMAVNPGVDPNNLLIGQIICVPGDPPSMRGPEFGRRFRDEFERRRREEFERRRREEEFERRRREFEHRPEFRHPY
jgi:LysM repeat protein